MKRNNPIPYEISSKLQNATAEMGPHITASWSHPIGINKVLKRLEPRLPETKNSFAIQKDRKDEFKNEKKKAKRMSGAMPGSCHARIKPPGDGTGAGASGAGIRTADRVTQPNQLGYGPGVELYGDCPATIIFPHSPTVINPHSEG